MHLGIRGKYRIAAPVSREDKCLLSVSRGKRMSRLVRGMGGVVESRTTTKQSRAVLSILRY